MFGQIYRKLERELQEKKRKMEAIIEKSNRAYEERDQAIEQMAQLKRQADLEQEEFRRRWEKLGQAIAENRKKLMDLQVAKAETDREEEKDAKVTTASDATLRGRVRWQAARHSLSSVVARAVQGQDGGQGQLEGDGGQGAAQPEPGQGADVQRRL